MLDSKPTTRRGFVQHIGLVVGAAGLCSRDVLHAADRASSTRPEDIIARLIEGNDRYASGRSVLAPRSPADFARDVEGQAPPAVILACADSRVAPELVFDQPIGALFVLRVAGNMVGSGPMLLGSIEYAVAELGAQLVVVMGHSHCGACKAAIEHIEHHDKLPGAIEGMVDYIRPVVREVRGMAGDKLVNVTKRNAIANAKYLASRGPILAERVNQGDLKLVGAYYELATGKVEFLA